MMRKMSKIREKFKSYSFFDPFPNTNYFAFVPHKSNEDRLVEAVLTLNFCSKSALKHVHDQLMCEHGKEAFSKDLESYYKIFIEHTNDFTKCLNGWDEQSVAKCERSSKSEFGSHQKWHHGIGTDKRDRDEAERKLIRAIAAR